MFKSKDSVIRKIVAKNNGNIEITSIETKEPIITSEKIKELNVLDETKLIKKTDYENTLFAFLNKDDKTYNGIRYNPKTNKYTSFKWTALQGFNFEVYPNDLPKMNWEAATKACAELGDGWRLPTKDELNLIYKNKDDIGGFSVSAVLYSDYWSSTEYNSSYGAWLQYFGNGLQDFNNKDGRYNVRAVRTF